MQQKRQGQTPRLFLDIFIITLIITNGLIFVYTFYGSKNKIGKDAHMIDMNPSNDGKETYGFRYSHRHIPPSPQEIDYNETELEEAIKGMNLPTWSRSYVPCNDSMSEVTCSQVVRAWRCLNGWSQYIRSHPFDKRKHFLMKHLYDGVGNRFSTDTTTFIIALMQNRTYIMEATYPKKRQNSIGQAYEFHPDVLLRTGEVDQYFKEEGDAIRSNIQTFDLWYRYDYDLEDHHKILYVDYLLYGTMMYTHHQLQEFSVKNFGLHAPYFVCNFLMKLPNKSIEAAKKAYSKVPANVRIFGVHLRFQFPGQFYSYNISTTIRTVIPFLKSKLDERPTMFAFASDSADMEKEFMKHFAKYTITVDTIRIPDFDHDSALNDIALLEMADELLITYRSTFSYVCAMRMGKRAWFVERESPGVFQASNSQATAVSALFHKWDVNDWQMNRRVHVNHNNEQALRYYNKYLLL